jgi:putative membrane protein
MKNSLKIFRADAKRLSTNVVAVVIIMGLSIIPSLYAWFNIFSNWNPYGAESTSNLKIAVYSNDAGADIEGVSFNIGSNVIDGLKENKSI